MERHKILFIIALIEILIGGITLLGTIASFMSSSNAKAPNVFLFVVITAFVSTLLGIGLLQLNRTAYELLIYFSSIIILSKILIFTNIITLNGALVISIPPTIKDGTSVLYHTFVIFYLNKKEIKALFIR